MITTVRTINGELARDNKTVRMVLALFKLLHKSLVDDGHDLEQQRAQLLSLLAMVVRQRSRPQMGQSNPAAPPFSNVQVPAAFSDFAAGFAARPAMGASRSPLDASMCEPARGDWQTAGLQGGNAPAAGMPMPRFAMLRREEPAPNFVQDVPLGNSWENAPSESLPNHNEQMQALARFSV